ncbi:MAG: hypothetical protein ABJD11_00900 [Gemmatimonadota bacterium]
MVPLRPEGWGGAVAVVLFSLLIVPLEGISAQQSARIPLVLSLPGSVRFAGLAGAGTAIPGDAASIFRNPAGLATIKHIAAEIAFQRYPDGTLETMGAAAFRLLQFDLGGGYQYLRMAHGSDVRDNLMWVGTAVYRSGMLAAGVSQKYVSLEDSSGKVSRAIGTDAGVTLAVFDIMALGVSIQNIDHRRVGGAPLDLPPSVHAGFTFNFIDPQSDARLQGTVETVWTRGESRRTIVGVETGIVLHGIGVVGRLGYGGQPAGSGQERTAFGAGLVFGRLGADYAFQRRTGLGGFVHRIGARWTL